MIKNKIEFVKRVLQDFPETAGDGNGIFLNKVVELIYGSNRVDFTHFNTEAYTRCRRKVLEKYVGLDKRTHITTQYEKMVMDEVTL